MHPVTRATYQILSNRQAEKTPLRYIRFCAYKVIHLAIIKSLNIETTVDHHIRKMEKTDERTENDVWTVSEETIWREALRAQNIALQAFFNDIRGTDDSTDESSDGYQSEDDKDVKWLARAIIAQHCCGTKASAICGNNMQKTKINDTLKKHNYCNDILK